GPGTVTFTPNASNLLARVTFSASGAYVLQLAATDTKFTNSDTVTIIVHEGINASPMVDAGPDLIAALPDPVILHTSATDDGLPDGALEVFWSQVSGPGAAYFSTVNGVYHANLTAPGTYVLRLTATDGALSARDDVTVTAYNAPDPPLVA